MAHFHYCADSEMWLSHEGEIKIRDLDCVNCEEIHSGWVKEKKEKKVSDTCHVSSPASKVLHYNLNKITDISLLRENIAVWEIKSCQKCPFVT